MGEMKFLLSILMTLFINECQVSGCTGVEKEKWLKRSLPNDDSGTQVDLRNAFGLKLVLPDYINALKRECGSKSHELKLERHIIHSSPKKENDNFKDILKAIKVFGDLLHSGEDQRESKENLDLRKLLILKQAFSDLILKLGSVQKDKLKRYFKSEHHECKLTREMFQFSSKEKKDDLMDKRKVIKDLPDLGTLVHNGKDQSKDQIGLSNKLRLKQAILGLIVIFGLDHKDKLKIDQEYKNHVLKLEREMFQSSSKEGKDDLMDKRKTEKDLTDFGSLINNRKDQSKDVMAMLGIILKLASDQKVKLNRDQENKYHGLKRERKLIQSSSEERNDDLIGKFKLMKEIANVSPKNKGNKYLELNHQYVLNNEATEQFAERIPVIIISPNFAEVGWKEVFGRKSQNEHHKGCNNMKANHVKAAGKVKKLKAAFSKSEDHNEKNRECEGNEYKKIACNICQCVGGRWRCTSLACDIKKLNDHIYLNSLNGMTKKMYDKLREEATGCIPGEEINEPGVNDCPCKCVLPSLIECQICPALEQIHLPKKTTAKQPEQKPFGMLG